MSSFFKRKELPWYGIVFKLQRHYIFISTTTFCIQCNFHIHLEVQNQNDLTDEPHSIQNIGFHTYPHIFFLMDLNRVWCSNMTKRIIIIKRESGIWNILFGALIFTARHMSQHLRVPNNTVYRDGSVCTNPFFVQAWFYCSE